MHPLKAHRAAKHLTQKQLADQFGVSRETLARWEIDVRKIDPARLPQITQLTGIPAALLRPDLAELMGEAE
jgi:transcriptional regulator with XRE-family HTH domain